MSATIKASALDAKLQFIGERVRGDIQVQRRLAGAMQYLAELLAVRFTQGGDLSEYPFGPVYELPDDLFTQHALLMEQFEKSDAPLADAINTLFRVLVGLQRDAESNGYSRVEESEEFSGPCSGCGGCNC